ncbi:hypothetical protein FOA52_012945 [Chlamydomonas sp. UWO 241]|nr:hypothetical protein FOA52_012945 [Chlamydomonas sp. UWO 241]
MMVIPRAVAPAGGHRRVLALLQHSAQTLVCAALTLLLVARFSLLPPGAVWSYGGAEHDGFPSIQNARTEPPFGPWAGCDGTAAVGGARWAPPGRFWQRHAPDPGGLSAALLTQYNVLDGGARNDLTAQLHTIAALQVSGYVVTYYISPHAGLPHPRAMRAALAAAAPEIEVDMASVRVLAWAPPAPPTRVFITYGSTLAPHSPRPTPGAASAAWWWRLWQPHRPHFTPPPTGLLNVFVRGGRATRGEQSWDEKSVRALSTYDYVLVGSQDDLEGSSAVYAGMLRIMFDAGWLMPTIQVLDVPVSNTTKHAARLEHLLERGLSTRPFRYFVGTALPALRRCAHARVAPPGEIAPLAAVIVESRAHFAFEYVVLSTMAVLSQSGRPWALHIYHSRNNAWLAKAIAAEERLNGTALHLIPASADISAYNDLLLTPAFWDAVSAHRILVFQTDSLLLRPGVESYLEYDYLGAPWEKKNDRWAQISSRVPEGVGNGGLSLRSVDLMRAIAATEKPDPGEQEDIFYARHVLRLSGNSSTRTRAYGFALEFPCLDIDPQLVGAPVGIHAAWYYHPEWRARQLLQSSFGPGSAPVRMQRHA